jgi:CBS domain-containing protein
LTERKRLGVVYVTDSGLQNGQLQGMVTAWDLAGSEKFKI